MITTMLAIRPGALRDAEVSLGDQGWFIITLVSAPALVMGVLFVTYEVIVSRFGLSRWLVAGIVPGWLLSMVVEVHVNLGWFPEEDSMWIVVLVCFFNSMWVVDGDVWPHVLEAWRDAGRSAGLAIATGAVTSGLAALLIFHAVARCRAEL